MLTPTTKYHIYEPYIRIHFQLLLYLFSMGLAKKHSASTDVINLVAIIVKRIKPFGGKKT